MKTFYYLSSCDTCKRIMSEIDLGADIRRQDIKTDELSETAVDAMKNLAGSYESLFSKRARLYKERNLKDEQLDESDFRELLLEHYTFLKRPVLVYDERVFIGNSKKNVSEMKNFLDNTE